MSKIYAAGILGIGCYVPEKILTNHDLEKMVEAGWDYSANNSSRGAA